MKSDGSRHYLVSKRNNKKKNKTQQTKFSSHVILLDRHIKKKKKSLIILKSFAMSLSPNALWINIIQLLPALNHMTVEAI